MTKCINRLLVSIAILSTAFVLQTAHADEALSPVSTTDQLTIQLPDVDRTVLIEKIRTLRSQLIQRKQMLAQSVADKKLDSGDAFITVIMPGGLLYAGYKKARYEEAKNELARVSADIETFTGDLLAMQSGLAPVVVAQLP